MKNGQIISFFKGFKKSKKVHFFVFFAVFKEKFDFFDLFKKGQKRAVFGQKRVIFDPFLNA